MTWDLRAYRLVTASAYPGMMAPLTEHPSCVCILSGNDEAGTSSPVLSLEAHDGVRRRWRFGDVSGLADFVPQILAAHPDDDRPILLVVPRASLRWLAAASAWPARVRVVAAGMDVVEPIAEDKVHVRAELACLGVPVPDAMIRPGADLDFADVSATLGGRFVLQTPNGAGGQGTYLVTDPESLAATLTAHRHDDAWLVSRFCGDVTINVAGLVHDDGVTLLPASVQSSGITELGSDFGAYCGSDFATDHLPEEVLRAAYRHTATVGQWLRRLGHRGLFGADIALDGDRLAFLEINPRIQGSSWLLSALQQADGAAPCLVRHVQALLGAPAGEQPPLSVRAGSHLLVRWNGPAGVVTSVSSGSPDETVTVTALPRVGVRIEPGAVIARLQASHSLTSRDGHHLLPSTRQIVDAIRPLVQVPALL